MPPPNPTPIFRFIHVENLDTLMRRDALHAPNHVLSDGLPYRFCHDPEVQGARAAVTITVGPGGTIHDYVPFYFGYLSPMMFKLKTGRVAGYDEGQEPLIYLVSTAQAVADAGVGFAFSDGHGLAFITGWFDRLERLEAVDWGMVYQQYWSDNLNDMDRQRRVGLPWARVSLDQRAGFGEECPAAQVGVTTPVRRIPLGRPRPLYTFPHPLKEQPSARYTLRRGYPASQVDFKQIPDEGRFYFSFPKTKSWSTRRECCSAFPFGTASTQSDESRRSAFRVRPFLTMTFHMPSGRLRRVTS